MLRPPRIRQEKGHQAVDAPFSGSRHRLQPRLGHEFAAQLLERGARRCTPGAQPRERSDCGRHSAGLDITDPESVARAAAVAGDATLLIDNAGVTTSTSLIDGDLAQIELEMKTNFYGPLHVTRAFAPILTSNGGGTILNVLSVPSSLHFPDAGAARRSEGRRVG